MIILPPPNWPQHPLSVLSVTEYSTALKWPVVTSMNHVSFQPRRYLICFNSNMALSFTHSSFFSFELTQTFPFSLHRLRQTMRGKNGEERACRFTYLFLPGRQAGSLECQCVAQQPLTDARSQWHNEHTHAGFASGWGSRVQLETDKTRSPKMLQTQTYLELRRKKEVNLSKAENIKKTNICQQVSSDQLS